jgi:hypothetical protein
MKKARTISLWIMLVLIVGLMSIGLLLLRQRRKPLTITGAVTVQDADPRGLK